MATQNGMNTTTLSETINPSAVAGFVIPTPAASPLYPVLCMQFDCTNLKATSLVVPRWDAQPATEEQVESDEYTAVNYSTSKVTFTGVDPGTRALITDQVVQDSGALTQSDMVGQMITNLRNTLDLMGLEVFKTATNMSDNTGVNLSLNLWQTALFAFRAQKPIGEIGFVGSNAQIRDLLKDMVVGVGAQQIAGAGSALFNSMKVDGYHAPYNGVHIFESANVAQADASNDVGGFLGLMMDAGGGPPAMSGIGLAIWQDITATGVYVPHRKAYDATITCRVDFKEVAPFLLRGFISKRAAA